MSDPNLMSWIDDGEQIRQDVNKVTEEDVKRVQASSAQAKKIQTQIKQDKITNNNFARFLQFLLQNIKEEELFDSIFNTFFKVTNPKTGAQYFRRKINDVVVVWFFVPFFPEKAKEYQIDQYYADILPTEKLNLRNYIQYIAKLSKKHHDNIPVDKSSLLSLLYYIILEFGLANKSSDRNEIISDVKKALH